MPRLTDLKQENHVTLHLSEEACYENNAREPRGLAPWMNGAK